jgi:hypothetical protein
VAKAVLMLEDRLLLLFQRDKAYSLSLQGVKDNIPVKIWVVYLLAVRYI